MANTLSYRKKTALKDKGARRTGGTFWGILAALLRSGKLPLGKSPTKLGLSVIALCGVLTMGVQPNHTPKFRAYVATLDPQPSETVPVAPIIKTEVVDVPAHVTAPTTAKTPEISTSGGLTGVMGYAVSSGNCVNQAGVNRASGNPISWPVLSSVPRVGGTALFNYNHVGYISGIWSNGDLEIQHQNYAGSQHRFPISAFRGFR